MNAESELDNLLLLVLLSAASASPTGKLIARAMTTLLIRVELDINMPPFVNFNSSWTNLWTHQDGRTVLWAELFLFPLAFARRPLSPRTPSLGEPDGDRLLSAGNFFP